jgi:UDP-N-acetylmuramoyl-L-alanyl-D-glutamate--2,6-diaminopimelate ligase
VVQVDHDSRKVRPGSLFCCVPGATSDGHAFAADAVRAGAVALIVERPLDEASLPRSVTQIRVAQVRAAMARAAAACWGHPSRTLTVAGVTGTNGKTTTTYLLRNILDEAGEHAAVLGTLSGPRTTPEAPELQRWFAEQVDRGITAVAMEVSSHALELHRVDATRFAVAVFTNLSRDHLDYHETMEAYFAAKATLFTPAFAARAVVNIDDPWGRRLAEHPVVPTVGFTMAEADALDIGAVSCRFRWRGHDVVVPMGGRFNVSNALAAAEAARQLGIDDAVIAAGLSRPVVIPGRFEPVDEGQSFTVLVDYAHTPDGLDHVLRAAREIAGDHRVHVVFGCGGDRDATKRPAMGAVAARLGDRVVITADNSRHEDTRAIISAVKDGFDRATEHHASQVVTELDRDTAIGLALRGARDGDVVVIAGKGHETTQTIGDTVIPFDDRDVARRHLRAIGGTR